MKKEDFTYAIDKHEKFFFSRLSECGKRHYAGLEAMKIGYYGVSIVAERLGIHKHTVRKGKLELLNEIVPPAGKVRQKGGGRKKKTAVIRELVATFLSLISSYTAGNPMDCGVLWTNLTLKQIQEKLKAQYINVSFPVIKQLLKSHKFVKRKMFKTKTFRYVANRDEQFRYIAKPKAKFIRKKLPVISIDTKKKEMIGNFYREGKAFCKAALRVFDHDFKSFSNGVAVPHGIYDLVKNICYLSIGTGKDTAEFVMDNIEYHWHNSIKNDYPDAKKILILCDGGGSNSSSHHIVKEQFYELSKRLQIEIVVAHYPAYCSKWNPIEHRAFSFISKEWEGEVFYNYDIIKKIAEQTTTKTGFTVKAWINTKTYQTGKKASKEFMQKTPIFFNKFLPKWNYGFSHEKIKPL